MNSGRSESVEMSQGRYSNPAIVMHWLSALVVFALLGLGWYLESLPKGPERGWFIGLHKSLGICLFVLTVLRLAWRGLRSPPPWPGDIPFWRQSVARWVHRLLYAALVIQPLSGYLSASFSGYPMLVFGYPLYSWGWKDAALNDLFSDVHEFSSLMLTLLVVIHLLGVISHAFTPGDRSIRRMLP